MTCTPLAPSESLPRRPTGTVYWMVRNAPFFSEERKLSFAIRPDGRPHTYILAVHAAAPWLRTSTITQLRLDPVTFPARVTLSDIHLTPWQPPEG